MEENNKFRVDLTSLVTNASIYTDLTDEKMKDLEEINKNFEKYLNEILSSTYKLEDADISNMSSNEEKLNYIKDNIWKLKPGAVGAMLENSGKVGKEKFDNEEKVRSDIENLIKSQDEVLMENSNLLKKYQENLLADKESVKELLAKNAGLNEEILENNEQIKELDKKIEEQNQNISAETSEISKLQQNIQEKENDNKEVDKEIDSLRLEIEQLQIAINRDLAKKQANKELIIKIKAEIKNAQNKGEDITELENQLSECEKEKRTLDANIQSAKTSILSKNSLINNKQNRKIENQKSINVLQNNIQEKNNDLKILQGEKKEKENIKKGIRSDIASKKGEIATNRTTIISYAQGPIDEKTFDQATTVEEKMKLVFGIRENMYQTKLKENQQFAKNISDSRDKIYKRFKELNIPAPNMSSTSSSKEIDSNQLDKQAEGTAKNTSGSTGGIANGVPANEKADLSDKELASNFVNDITRYGNSPEELRLKLTGYGYGTFVNALPELSNGDRKKVLRVLKERLNEVKTHPNDELDIDDILGDGAYDLIMENGVPRDLNTLSNGELRKLREIIDNYNTNILDFNNDQIKILDEKFFDTLAISMLVSEYSSGKLAKFIADHKGEESLLRRELIGSMKFYHKSKVERFKKVVDKGNVFFENLHREKNPVVIENLHKTNVPEISRHESSLQEEYRNR